MSILLFVAGLVFLIVGAEAMVRGASRMAAALGISPLVIGLTVVAFGTSSPELAVGIKAALSDQGSIAVGNVVGSNIFNVLVILGLSAVIVPLVVSQQLVRFDVPLMIGLSVLVLVFAWDGAFRRADGLLLLTGLVLYFWFLIYQSRRTNATPNEAAIAQEPGSEPVTSRWVLNLTLVAAGLALLVLGSRWLVDSAVSFAQYLGVSELVIGLTIVAAGTSLPEAVTSAVAAMRGERDIAVGNVVGSNIFNIMGVLGFVCLLSPSGIAVPDVVIGFDIPIMIAVAFACLPLFYTGGMISRPEGALLLAYYAAYSLYVILAATQHDALPRFSAVMLYFVIPLTAVTLVVLALRELRYRKGSLPESKRL